MTLLIKMKIKMTSTGSIPKDTVSTDHLDIDRWENDGGRITSTTYIY